MTGSGMGCPDWPKCFGQWVPPTDISQLPADYKVRFEVVGKEIADFDAFKTWVEYLNRLVGVLIGFFCIATFAAAFSLRKAHPQAFWLSLLALVTVVVQGGIGAVVVRTNLHAGMITVHMVIALILAGLLVSAYLTTVKPSNADISRPQMKKTVLSLGLLVLLVTLAQVIMGTQVRERVDELAILLGESLRGTWLAEAGGIFNVHKLFSNLVFGAILVWVIQARPIHSKTESVLIWSMTITVVLEIAIGLGMNLFEIPKWLQPFHLVGAVLLFLEAFTLYLWQRKIYFSIKVVKQDNPVSIL